MDGVEYPSVMAAVRSVGSSVDRKVGKAVASKMQYLRQEVTTKTDSLRQEVARLTGKVVVSVADLNKWAKRYEVASASLPSGHEIQNIKAHGQRSLDLLQKVVPMVVNLDSRVSKVEQGGASRMVQGSAPGGSTTAATPSALEAEVKLLKAEIDTLKAKGDKSSVEMGGLTFRSKMDCRAFRCISGFIRLGLHDFIASTRQ